MEVRIFQKVGLTVLALAALVAVAAMVFYWTRDSKDRHRTAQHSNKKQQAKVG